MRRHDLVTLHPGSLFTFACGAGEPSLRAAVRQWIDLGRPLVVARQPADGGGLFLGLTLPLERNRQRVTCIVEPGAVAAVAPPLTLERGLQRLAPASAGPLRRLARRIAASGATIGVFGSLAWEALSGEAYRHAESDIDVICDVQTHGQYHLALAALAEAARDLPCRLDGELRFPNGGAVAWRELEARRGHRSAEVLAKAIDNVCLVTLDDLLATLDQERRYA